MSVSAGELVKTQIVGPYSQEFCCVDECPQICIPNKFPVVTDDITEPGSSAVDQTATHTALKVKIVYLCIQSL